MLRVSCFFVADGAKTEPKAEDLLEVEPLVSRVKGRLESLKSLLIFGLEKGQKYSLFMDQVHNTFIINTTFYLRGANHILLSNPLIIKPLHQNRGLLYAATPVL